MIQCSSSQIFSNKKQQFLLSLFTQTCFGLLENILFVVFYKWGSYKGLDAARTFLSVAFIKRLM